MVQAIFDRMHSIHIQIQFLGYATLFVGEPQIEAYENIMRFANNTLNSFTSHLYTLCVFIFNIQHVRSQRLD